MGLSHVLQTLVGGPLQHKTQGIGEDAYKPYNEGMFHGAQFIQLIAHVCIVLGQFTGTVQLD